MKKSNQRLNRIQWWKNLLGLLRDILATVSMFLRVLQSAAPYVKLLAKWFVTIYCCDVF
jgi:hypothetical protein